MKEDWIEKNIEKMMAQIMLDVRLQKPLPLKITMNGIAFKKFTEILKSKACFFPEKNGSFKFLEIPVYLNNNLPMGCFTVERFKSVKAINSNA